MTDEQLSRRATAGDQEAFLELFSRHERGLLNFCHRMTGSREDAADLVQESFLRVFARLGSLEGREVNLAAYLRRTARNLVYDGAAGRGGEVMVDDLEVLVGADPALETDPERAMLLADQQEAVQRANAALPERHRLALALRELEDMDYAEIGEVLEVTPDAVAQLLVRARLGLRRQLRLASVDEERMAPACRARLADIGALIDGQLDADRAYVLRQHLATCATCGQVRSSFEDARIRYRAWLPIPVLLGLGAETLRAAEARGLLRPFTDSVSWDDPAGGAAPGGSAAGGGVTGAAGAAAGLAGGSAGATAHERHDQPWASWSARRRAGALAGAALVLLIAGGGSAVFALRGDEPPAPETAAVITDTSTITVTTGLDAAPPAAAPELPKPPLPAEDAAAAPGPARAPAAPRAPVAPGVTGGGPAPVAPPPTRTAAPGPAAPAPPPDVTVAAPDPVAPADPAPPTDPAPPPSGATPPTTTRQPDPPPQRQPDPPPTTTRRPDPPPATTTGRTPNDPPPATTVRVPTIRVPVVPPTTIRLPTIRIPVRPPTDPPVPR